MEGIIAMNKKQRQLYQLANEVIRQKLTIREFSLLTGKCYRQSRRIVARVRKRDALALVHGNQGRAPHNRTSRVLEGELEALLRTKYYDFNLTHFREMIFEREGLRAGKNVIHRVTRIALWGTNHLKSSYGSSRNFRRCVSHIPSGRKQGEGQSLIKSKKPLTPYV